jgi:hypothetical protein
MELPPGVLTPQDISSMTHSRQTNRQHGTFLIALPPKFFEAASPNASRHVQHIALKEKKMSLRWVMSFRSDRDFLFGGPAFRGWLPFRVEPRSTRSRIGARSLTFLI